LSRKIVTSVDPKIYKSFADLLQAIITSHEDQFAIVAHGFLDGSGLWDLPLVPGRHGTSTMAADLDRLSKIAARPDGSVTEADMMDLNLKKKEIELLADIKNTLHGKKKFLKAKRVTQVEFRGCALGCNKTSLQIFREFIGAASLGAPDIESMFGPFTPLIGVAHFKTHTKSHRSGTESYQFKLKSSNADQAPLIWCIIPPAPGQHDYTGHVVATNQDALKSWVNEFVSPIMDGKDGLLPLHFLWEPKPPMPAVIPMAAQLTNTMRPQPYFPSRPEYDKHIIYDF
jgi:hypothetical protein